MSPEGVVDSNKGQLPQGSLQASISPPPRHSGTQRGNCALWQNILEHDACGIFFFSLLNKWMCLGAAWEAEAPPTHLEALNSLKGPGVRRQERKASSQLPLWESLLWPLLGLYLAPLALPAVGVPQEGGWRGGLPSCNPPPPPPHLPLPSPATRFPPGLSLQGRSILVPQALASRDAGHSTPFIQEQPGTNRAFAERHPVQSTLKRRPKIWGSL